MVIPIYEARQFYYKLHQRLRLALGNDDLSCHANSIIVELGKSIESQQTYYNPSFDKWCEYFLRCNGATSNVYNCPGGHEGRRSNP